MDSEIQEGRAGKRGQESRTVMGPMTTCSELLGALILLILQKYGNQRETYSAEVLLTNCLWGIFADSRLGYDHAVPWQTSAASRFVACGHRWSCWSRLRQLTTTFCANDPVEIRKRSRRLRATAPRQNVCQMLRMVSGLPFSGWREGG